MIKRGDVGINMVGRREVLRAVTVAGLASVAGCNGDGSGTATTTMIGDTMPGFEITTAAFDDGGTVPIKYTCSGADVSPPLSIEGVPDEAVALALVVDDPDAPGGVFTHWLLWNVPPGTGSIPEGVPTTETVDDLGGARQGTNDFGEIGYRGPCPPKSDGAHTYRFKLFALDAELDVDAGVEASAVNDAIDDHRVATARLTGEFNRD
ncbi:MAG: Raf kinase inhibitor-like YbhB/YbcL family protein [Halobacteriales archaeon]